MRSQSTAVDLRQLHTEGNRPPIPVNGSMLLAADTDHVFKPIPDDLPVDRYQKCPLPIPQESLAQESKSTSRTTSSSTDYHIHKTLQQTTAALEETERRSDQHPPVPKHGIKGQQPCRANLASTTLTSSTSLDRRIHKTLRVQQMTAPLEEAEQSFTKDKQPPPVPEHGVKNQQNPTPIMRNLPTSLAHRSYKSLPRVAVFPKEKKRNFIKDKQSPPVPKSEASLNHSLTDEQPTPASTRTPGNLTFSLDHHVHKTLEQMTATHESDHSCLKDEPASPDPPTTLTSFTLSINPHVHKVLEQMTDPQETEDTFTRELPPPVPERTQNYNETVNNSMKHRLLRSFRRDRWHRKKPKKEDPKATPQTVTFAVDQHIHSALQQIAAIQNHTDKEGTDTVVHREELPPSAPRRKSTDQDVMPTAVQDGNQSKQTSNVDSENQYQPLLPRRLYAQPQENADYHLLSALQQIATTQNRTDKEGTDTVVHRQELPPSAPRRKSTDQDVMPTAVQDGSQNKQMSNVDSENHYQPLLPRRLYAQHQENTDYQAIIRE